MKNSIRNQNHLILGATGALGYGHVKALLERGAQVTVLVRSAERAHVLFGEHENLDVAVGDICRPTRARSTVPPIPISTGAWLFRYWRSTSPREAHNCPNGGYYAEDSA